MKNLATKCTLEQAKQEIIQLIVSLREEENMAWAPMEAHIALKFDGNKIACREALRLIYGNKQVNDKIAARWIAAYKPQHESIIINEETNKLVETSKSSEKDTPVNQLDLENFDDIMSRIIRQQKECGYLNIKRYHVDFKSDSPIGLIFLEDLHIGGKSTDYDSLLHVLNVLKNTPNMYAVLGGDMLDNFISPRMLEAVQDTGLSVMDQCRILDGLLAKYGSKIIWMLTGNHDVRTANVALVDLTRMAAERAGKMHIGHGDFVEINVNDIHYKIMHYHKYRRGNSQLNRCLAQKRMWEDAQETADAYVLGHRHSANVETFHRHGSKLIALNAATFKRNDEYSLGLGYADTGLQIPVLIMDHNDKKITMIDSFQTACDLLNHYNENSNKKTIWSPRITYERHPFGPTD